jgi:hypothetical protein
MAEFLDEYLRAGLSQIVVIDYSHKEESSGYQNEHTHETVVAFDGRRYVRAECGESKIFSPPGGREFSGPSTVEITKAQYEELSKGLARSDTPAAVQALKDRKATRKVSHETSEQLHASAPKCPKCGNPLTPRNGPRGRFWGCKSYPACNGTAPFTSEHHRLYDIASRLP